MENGTRIRHYGFLRPISGRQEDFVEPALAIGVRQAMNEYRHELCRDDAG